MSRNYSNYQNYYKNQPNYQNYQMTYYNGKIQIQKRHKKDPRKQVMKKNVLKKFETLENKLLDYLAEFVKYTDSCKKQTPTKPIPSGKKGSRVASPAPATTRPIEKPPIRESPFKRDNLFPSNLERKIIEIERKTKNIQRYNQMLEDSFKKVKIGNRDQEAIVLDSNLKETIFNEVKKLEDILIEKRLEDQNLNMKDIPEYEHCQVMLQECIGMLGDAIKEEQEETKKIKKLKDGSGEMKQTKQVTKPLPKKKDITEIKPSKKNQDMSDDEFFGQFNLDINDEEYQDVNTNEAMEDQKAELKNRMAETNEIHKGLINQKDPQKDLEDTEFGETDEEQEAADEVGPLKYIGGVRLRREQEEVYEEEEEEEEPIKYIEHDKRKLYQIQEELSKLEHNNKKFLYVLKDLKKNLITKNLDEEEIESGEFVREVNQIRQVTRNFEVGEKNVDKLIGKLNKNTRYSF